MALTLKDIKNVVEGNNNYYLSTLSPEVLSEIDKRMEACPLCVTAGKCIKCGCKTPEMFYALSKTCPDNKWGAITN